MPPRVLDGRYQLDAPLGAGGQGRVFRGRDLETKRVLALKLMEEGAEDDPELIARFVQEGRLAARIRDPRLMAALYFGVADGQRYIVYDYIPGVAPVTTLVEEGRMEPSIVCDLALQLLDVLSTLHKAGVVHQDVAEENILWCRRPSGRIELYLIDLGSASSTISGGRRAARSPVGHDSFMAPEMVDGGACDHRVDLWSVGALMYVLLTSRYVDYGTFEEPLEIPSPALLVPSIPRPLSDVVMRALDKREQRFASAEDMIAAIHALDLPVVTMPSPFGVPTPSRAPRTLPSVTSRRLRPTPRAPSRVALAGASSPPADRARLRRPRVPWRLCPPPTPRRAASRRRQWRRRSGPRRRTCRRCARRWARLPTSCGTARASLAVCSWSTTLLWRSSAPRRTSNAACVTRPHLFGPSAPSDERRRRRSPRISAPASSTAHIAPTARTGEARPASPAPATPAPPRSPAHRAPVHPHHHPDLLKDLDLTPDGEAYLSGWGILQHARRRRLQAQHPLQLRRVAAGIAINQCWSP